MELTKSIIEKIIMDLEKQYKVLIFFSLIGLAKIFSGGALENVLDDVGNIFNENIPEITKIIYTLFNGNFIYNFTKILAMTSALSLIVGMGILIIQLIYDKYSRLGITRYGFQYTVDLFGGISITLANIYIFIWILTNTFHKSKVYLYAEKDSILFGVFMLAASFSIFMSFGLFIYGKPNKNTDILPTK